MGNNVDLLQWFISFLIKRLLTQTEEQELILKTKNWLANYTISKFEKWKTHLSFIDNIWGADLAGIQLVSKFSKGMCLFVVCYWYLQ